MSAPIHSLGRIARLVGADAGIVALHDRGYSAWQEGALSHVSEQHWSSASDVTDAYAVGNLLVFQARDTVRWFHVESNTQWSRPGTLAGRGKWTFAVQQPQGAVVIASNGEKIVDLPGRVLAYRDDRALVHHESRVAVWTRADQTLARSRPEWPSVLRCTVDADLSRALLTRDDATYLWHCATGDTTRVGKAAWEAFAPDGRAVFGGDDTVYVEDGRHSFAATPSALWPFEAPVLMLGNGTAVTRATVRPDAATLEAVITARALLGLAMKNEVRPESLLSIWRLDGDRSPKVLVLGTKSGESIDDARVDLAEHDGVVCAAIKHTALYCWDSDGWKEHGRFHEGADLARTGLHPELGVLVTIGCHPTRYEHAPRGRELRLRSMRDLGVLASWSAADNIVDYALTPDLLAVATPTGNPMFFEWR